MKRIFTLGITLFAILQTSSAQGVKQLWGVSLVNTLYSIDTSTFVKTVRRDFSANGDGADPIDFTVFKGKIFGTMNRGTFLYEFDPLTNHLDKRAPSTDANDFPLGIVRHINRKNNTLYILSGSAIRGGNDPFDFDFTPVSKWDTDTETFTEIVKDEHEYLNYDGPFTEFNGKFYCLGDNRIYEWEPENNAITPKFQFPGNVYLTSTTFPYQLKSPTALGNKLYILGISDLYEWDPESPAPPVVKHSFARADDYAQTEAARFSLIEKNGKLYGFTNYGSKDDKGVIFEWDPVAGYSKKIEFADYNLKGEDIYHFMSGGENEILFICGGQLVRYIPASNTIIIKESTPISWGDVIHLIPAPVSLFTTGSCTDFPEVTIDATNNNSWVAVTDSKGDVLAEVMANGNSLGTVNTQAYINSGAIRRDGRDILTLIEILPSLRKTPVSLTRFNYASILQRLSLKH